MFAIMAVTANLLTAAPAMAQDKKPMAKKHVVVVKKHSIKKHAAKKAVKSAHAAPARQAKKK
jgi:hypothetical protein